MELELKVKLNENKLKTSVNIATTKIELNESQIKKNMICLEEDFFLIFLKQIFKSVFLTYF